ncbi:NAD(P)-dependent oxidoreductase [Brevibacterium sp. XM4083]|uniref:NAD(P)-dependent oxidoreductase n=1 Tax=Brevibacterium sp. XM4083 TaxID=2583238 RepID=UPI0015E8000A|nr:NAD(P)-dependent oxidoreductase [Brevibacterium sp. XM4083]MCM1012628.1 NAD(P)-dependent oxidoreductase [Brevibacterium sp. XM4083]
MRILLFGASGWIGTHLSAHLGAEHEIIGVVRSLPEGPVAYTPLVCPDWVDHPETVKAGLADLGAEVDAAVAAIGGWSVGDPVLARGLTAFDAVYASHLRGHFTAAGISADLGVGTHLALNGVASIEALSGSGAISVFGAAQSMLIRVADAETADVRFRELTILAPVSGDDRNDLTGGVETIDIAEVSAAAAAILERGEIASVESGRRESPGGVDSSGGEGSPGGADSSGDEEIVTFLSPGR